MNLDAIMDGLRPSPEELQRLEDARSSLIAACNEALQGLDIKGVATVQGSAAKGTWLAGSTDLDAFLLLDQSVPEGDLEDIVSKVAASVLEGPRKKYAQHPYLIGTRDGFQVDLVPAYKVAEATAKMSAVDRTPFHTAWVLEHLDDHTRDQVRLLKQWCKGVGIYGAETAIGGISGYLAEVLVHQFHGFEGVIEWFAAGMEPRRIAVTEDDVVEDDVSPLIVVDPVDAARNCAAAVQADIIDRALAAATAFRAGPTDRFFYPHPPRQEPADVLHASLQERQERWLGIELRAKTDRLDIVFPQFQKAGRSIGQALDDAGFPLRRHAVLTDDAERSVWMHWVSEDITLPEERIHSGPPADKEPNATSFRDKWSRHPDAIGPAETGDDGRLQVKVRVPHRTADVWLSAHLLGMGFGKHVAAALKDGRTVLSDPTDAPHQWAAATADMVLDRRPWER